MIDLGYMNGWKETPDMVKKCREKGHETTSHKFRTIGGTVQEYRCDLCGYKYKVDSGD